MKAILFDIDGTLVDSNDYHVQAWDEALRSAGRAFSHQRLHDQIGKGGDNLVTTLLPYASDEDAERLSDQRGTI